jgi:hypothetical protein
MSKFPFPMILSVAAVFELVACQKQTVPPAQNTAVVATTNPTTTAATADPGAPKALSDSAESAEVIYDAVKTGKWSEAEARIDQLRQSAATYPALQPEVETLAASIKARDRVQSAKLANELTRLAIEQLRDYPATTPVDIAMLDYEGRKVEVDAAQNDLAGLKDAARQLRQTWDGVRPTVESHGGAAESKTFEVLVLQLEGAKSVPEYNRIAGSILNEVDRLEAVFTRSPQHA